MCEQEVVLSKQHQHDSQVFVAHLFSLDISFVTIVTGIDPRVQQVLNFFPDIFAEPSSLPP
jgi:hypothetical protein